MSAPPLPEAKNAMELRSGRQAGPRARKVPHTEVNHGIVRRDPYHWLRDPSWREVLKNPQALAPAIRQHLEAENAHTSATMGPTQELQQALAAELEGRIPQDDTSLPRRHGPWEYYARVAKGQQYGIWCRRPAGQEDGEEILFDANVAAQGHRFFNIASVAHSPDHSLLALGIDTRGSEYFEITFKDLETGQMLPDKLPNTRGAVAFARDGKTVFYTRVSDDGRPTTVLRHELGTDATKDVVVYDESDPAYFVGVDTTADGKWVVINLHDHHSSEQWLVDAHDPTQPPRLVAPRQDGILYDVDSLGDQLLIKTNINGAEDFKLMVASPDSLEAAQWLELVPHQPGVLITGVLVFSDHIVRLEKQDALPRIVVRDRATQEEHVIAFDEPAYSLGLDAPLEPSTHVLRFSYSSMTTPTQTFDYDMRTRERTLRHNQVVPSGHDPAQYKTERVFATGHDGAQIPVSILRSATTPIDGSAPLLLYGYGAYGHAMPPSFSTNVLSLVDRGFVYAIAHVRGGKDKGFAWYREGKMMQKKNTFLDFIAAAEHLCATGHTKPGNITIQGGSAGGLLVGAVANMRPDLFRAVVAQVPFVDVTNTICDATLPLTPPEWVEWGNPIESREAYEYIASYSPYDNVQCQAYPHMLVTAGLTDPRVTYWEPAKWVARLRERKTNDTMLLLETNMGAGHGGASGRYDALKERARVFAFVLLAHGMAGDD